MWKKRGPAAGAGRRCATNLHVASLAMGPRQPRNVLTGSRVIHKANKVWLVVVMILLVGGVILQSLAVGTPGWLDITCREGALTVGLWMLCGTPLSNVTLTQMRTNGHDDHRHVNTSVNVSANVINNKSLKLPLKHFDPGDESIKNPARGTGLFRIKWSECYLIHLKVADPYPVWFQATQMLETMGVGCIGLTTLLLTMYSCAPTFMVLQVALGFAAASFTAAGFIIVGMFNISGGKSGVGAMVPDTLTCDTEGAVLSYSFELATIAVALLGIAGVVATLASVLEKGDANENRINRKVEDAPSEFDTKNAFPISPTPPSTISDESTPLSFESSYDCDNLYSYNGKHVLKKKVSFQRKPQNYSTDSISHCMQLHPVTQSAPHIMEPSPRRQSVQQSSNHQEPLPVHTGRQSSPLCGNRRSSASRQDSVSSKDSIQSNRHEHKDRAARSLNARRSSSHIDALNRRQSRT